MKTRVLHGFIFSKETKVRTYTAFVEHSLVIIIIIIIIIIIYRT